VQKWLKNFFFSFWFYLLFGNDSALAQLRFAYDLPMHRQLLTKTTLVKLVGKLFSKGRVMSRNATCRLGVHPAGLALQPWRFTSAR